MRACNNKKIVSFCYPQIKLVLNKCLENEAHFGNLWNEIRSKTKIALGEE